MIKLLKLDSKIGTLILRITIGILFIVYGISKFQRGMESIGLRFDDLGIPLPLLMAWVVSVIEIVGGSALVLGFKTRIFAPLLTIIIIGTLLTAKIGTSFIGGWDLNIVVLVSLIVICIQGAGKFSLSRKNIE